MQVTPSKIKVRQLFSFYESDNVSNISFFQVALNKAKGTYERESRKVKTGLIAEQDRTVSRAQLNSLTATLAPPSESTVAPSQSPTQPTTTKKNNTTPRQLDHLNKNNFQVLHPARTNLRINQTRKMKARKRKCRNIKPRALNQSS